MRILYLSFNDPYASLGVHNKEMEFCAAMGDECRKSGHAFLGVNVFTPECGDGAIPGDTEYLKHKQATDRFHNVFGRVRLARAVSRAKPLLGRAYDIIREYQPDVILWRYDITLGIINPKRVSPGILFVSEHHAKEVEELSLGFSGRLLSPLLCWIEKKTFACRVDAVVGVTSEISEYECSRLQRNIPTYTHTNGIDVERYGVSRYKPFSGDVLKMLFVGSTTAPWHGIDRVIRGIAKYRGPVQIKLHMVGDITPEINNLIDLYGIRDKIEVHGVCYGKDLDKIFDMVHIAVGTLGLHRQKLLYGSTLKIREYMARGVPFIISYIDEDIELDFPLYLRQPPDDMPINVDEVIQFAQNITDIYGNRIPTLMRAYALEHMDTTKKVKEFLNFLTNIHNQYSE